MTNSNEKFYVGIDVSKAVLDVVVLPLKKEIQVKNNAHGIKKLIKTLTSFSSVMIVMEATGGYEKAAAHALVAAHFSVAVVNPRQIRDFAKAVGKLAKTDQLDAQVIALFAEKIQPKARGVCNENQQKLAARNSRRRQLMEMITMEKNRLDKTADEDLKRSIQRIITTLEKELAAIEKTLENLIQQDEASAQKNELLQSIKGVGKVVAASMLCDLPELGRLSAKEISALAGLAPYNRDSGTVRGIRTIWGGRASVRCALYMATLVAIRHNVQIKKFYDRLCATGKQKKVAITACMHKLLIIMNAMIKHNQRWQPTSA